jgi:hypothetical protein
MTASEFLSELRSQGFQVRPLLDGRVGVRPWSQLTEAQREGLGRWKVEILTLLTTSGGLSFDDVAEVFPGAEDLTPAVVWLRRRLAAGPRPIAILLNEWIAAGRCEGDRKQEAVLTQALMEARAALGVRADEGPDGTMMWRLPRESRPMSSP